MKQIIRIIITVMICLLRQSKSVLGILFLFYNLKKTSYNLIFIFKFIILSKVSIIKASINSSPISRGNFSYWNLLLFFGIFVVFITKYPTLRLPNLRISVILLICICYFFLNTGFTQNEVVN